jgi:aminoglycoside phosphotransferase (APT) family kinase protein
MVLKVFTPGFADVSRIGPVDTAKKCALALRELSKRAIPTPRLFGYAQQGESAAILVETIMRVQWNSRTRTAAAESLSRLHRIELEPLSAELVALINRSAPNRHRILRGLTNLTSTLDTQYPRWHRSYPALAENVNNLLEGGELCTDMRTLVHGDFFSANLLQSPDGLRIIDWEMLALGDPTWDLGFLIGADRGLASREVDRVVSAYSSQRPVDTRVLLWHKKCWDAYWELRDVVRLMRTLEKARSPT